MVRKNAFVLSGGGARGAYEVGVLSYVFGELSRIRGAPPPVHVLSGTSVGAINACFLAAQLHAPMAGAERLEQLWRGISLDEILGFGVKHLALLPRMLMGGTPEGVGLFDVSPIAGLVNREIDWRMIARSLAAGHLGTLSVSATEVSTGRTVVFMQTGPEGTLPTTAPPRTVIRADRIGPAHALASAAIPLIFPPVRIGSELYVDGSLRQNTPIAPATRLGATHVFAIGLSREERGIRTAPKGVAPGAAFLLGKVLNAFLLDHVDHDLAMLGQLNDVIDDGVRAFGPSFEARLGASAAARGQAPYRRVEALTIRPSEDIGRLAAEHVRRGSLRGKSMVVRRMLSLLDVGAATESDLASYLLFDGGFAGRLIDLGRADAAARRGELLRFFGDRDDDAPVSGRSQLSSAPGTIPPPPVVGLTRPRGADAGAGWLFRGRLSDGVAAGAAPGLVFPFAASIAPTAYAGPPCVRLRCSSRSSSPAVGTRRTSSTHPPTAAGLRRISPTMRSLLTKPTSTRSRRRTRRSSARSKSKTSTSAVGSCGAEPIRATPWRS